MHMFMMGMGIRDSLTQCPRRPVCLKASLLQQRQSRFDKAQHLLNSMLMEDLTQASITNGTTAHGDVSTPAWPDKAEK